MAKETFRQAVERKLYDPGVHAATNDREYFAKLTCAYLDRMDYFPHTRDELKRHDPKGYELMEKVWGRLSIRKGAAATGPKLPSPDGNGQFPLDTTTARLQLGSALVGTVPAKTERAGKPVLVVLFPVTGMRSLAALSRVGGW